MRKRPCPQHWNVLGTIAKRTGTFAAMHLPLLIAFLSCTATALAGGINGSGLNGGWRWDAAPRTISGNERSLDGGLR